MCSSLLKHSVWLISQSTGFHQLLKSNNQIALLKVLQELIFFQLHIMPYSKWSWVILQRTYGHQSTPADWTPPNLHQRTNLSHLSQMWDITVFLLTLFFYKNRINLHHYQLTKRKKQENNHNFAKTFHYKESLMYFIF